MTELVHVELASGWRHFSCLIDRNKLLSGRSQMVTKPWEPDLKQEQATFFRILAFLLADEIFPSHKVFGDTKWSNS